MKMNLDRDPETNRRIETFAIVSCGSKKADEEVPAADLYTSTHFQYKRRWAELYCDNWLILSAEHGLINPKKRLEPYDTSVRDLDDESLQEWTDDVEQTLWYRSNSYEGKPAGNDVAWDELDDDFSPHFELVLLAGTAYIDPFDGFFDHTFPAPVFTPLSGMGIGVQNSWLKTWVEAHPSLDDITDETAVAIDFDIDDTGDADVFYTRHNSGNIMVVPTSEKRQAKVLNETPEEGYLNSPATAMKDDRCWTVPVTEVPEVEDPEWECEPTLADFSTGEA
ncbi:DUF6884 domain-containing protein [Haloarcula onubensis]|uniref:DUF6884 domain-containing protein n=1 Tax=Haloarcula onubensis TaxID=2950539 RepID=A0ABU2FV91_9EURY|nr:DUF6884 domain-containing protein [Halomicroarcula sp. S3CR25-11]MDS0284693.1 hypothetical protein [Halomicroarcula sp. S3CR25-11]